MARRLPHLPETTAALPGRRSVRRSGQGDLPVRPHPPRRRGRRPRPPGHRQPTPPHPVPLRAAPVAPADGSAGPDRAEEVRRVSFGTTDTGHWRLSALLPLDDGALVERALTTARHTLFRHDVDGTEVTWADALVAVADTSLATDVQGRPHRPPPRPGPPRHRRRLAPRRARATRPPPPLPHLRHPDTPRVGDRRQTGQCRTGHANRAPPHPMVIENRDRGCRVPGCPRTRWLHIHHLTHWEHGGPTDTNNLIALCAHHHRLHHHHHQLGHPRRRRPPRRCHLHLPRTGPHQQRTRPTTRRPTPTSGPTPRHQARAVGTPHSANPSTPTGSTSANLPPHPTDAFRRRRVGVAGRSGSSGARNRPV